LWPYLALCAGVALVVTLGDFHRGHQGDTLLPVLVSLQRWTPFFWEQDRIGMLIPLLTFPLRNPFLNLLAQEALNVFAALAAMFLLARYMLRDRTYPLAGTLSAAACLALAPAAWFFCFTAVTFYGVWLALGLGGLVLAEARPGTPRPWWRWLLALGLMVLAHWVYSATALVLGPLVVVRFLLFREGGECSETENGRNGETAICRASVPVSPFLRFSVSRLLAAEVSRHLLLLGLGFALGIVFLRLASPPYHTNLKAHHHTQWPEICRRLLSKGWGCLAPHHWPYFLFGTAVAGMLPLGVATERRQAGVAWRSAVALGAAAAVYFLFMCTRRWVHLNNCDGRYAFPSLFLLQGALAIVAVGPLAAANRRKEEPKTGRNGETARQDPGSPRFAVPPIRRFAGAVSPVLQFGVAAVGLFLAALSSYHSPSLHKVRRDLDQTLGSYTADILAAGCTHVAGDYWKVWPAVFHANLVLHEQGESRTVWGISHCGTATRAQWEHLPLEDIRVAVPIEDRQNAETWLQAFHFPPLVIVERRPTIYVLRPAAVVAREQSNLAGGHKPIVPLAPR
jgi:hypothetical protein